MSSVHTNLHFCALFLAVAHGGGQDQNGGHFNSKTGEYHFHHGEKAHFHTLGYCPVKHQFFGYELPTLLMLGFFLLLYYLILRQRKIAGLN